MSKFSTDFKKIAKISFGVRLDTPVESILDASKRIKKILLLLYSYDENFRNVLFTRNNNKYYNLGNINDELFVNHLAGEILNYNKRLIKTYEDEKNPNLEYKSKLGFTCMLLTSEKEETGYRIWFNLGGNNGGGITLEHINPYLSSSFQSYYSLMQMFISDFNVVYGLVSPHGSFINNAIANLKIKESIGWITYFTKQLGYEIPLELSDIETIKSENGVFFILTRDNMLETEEKFIYYRQKMLNAMSEMKLKVVQYSNE